MTLVEASALGVVQGLTEFLPVSSSGHLIVFPELFGFQEGGLGFDTMVHLGTFFAVLVVFWADVVGMVKGLLGAKEHAGERRLAWWVAGATVPVVVLGLLLGESERLRTPLIVAVSLIVWGVVLAAADWYARGRTGVDAVEQVGWKRSLAVGVAQVLALIPGTSRSGITMSAGLFAGLDRKTAARFSFLLSLPAVGGAGAYVLIDSLRQGVTLFTPALVVGFVASFLSGMLAIRFLLRVIARWSFVPFALYRVVLGVILLLWFV